MLPARPASERPGMPRSGSPRSDRRLVGRSQSSSFYPPGGRRSGAGSDQSGRLAVVDADRIVKTGQLEDLAVVLAQAEGQESLALALHAHEQRHQQADAAAI